MKKKKKSDKSILQKIIEKEKDTRDEKNQGLKSIDKSTMNKRLIYIMVLFIGLFLAIVLYLVFFQLFKSQSIAEDSHNKRLWVNENEIERGKMYDRNGELIAYSEKDENGIMQRIYNFSTADSTFTGYNSTTYGKSGLEKNYNNYLLDISDKSYGKIRNMIEKSGTGNDLHLSINQAIQTLAYNALQDKVGAVIVMNPTTGEVLAMVTNPTFDPNNLDSNWESLIQNSDAPLLNRVTQGVYRPGSTMKIVTATAILENGTDQDYKDTGTETIQGYDIKNFGDEVYGSLNLRSAFINSVNTYFAKKTDEMGKDEFQKVAESFMFNKKYDFDLDTNYPKIPFADLNQVDLAMTGFGYGKTEVNPLHMAMVVSSIANDGKMMKPILVNEVKDKDGKTIKENQSEVLSTVTSEENAQYIRDLMVGVVNEGTATGAYLDGIQVAGKTGTADKDNGSTDAWFVGFAPAYNPQIAIALVLENDGSTGGESAAPLAGELISNIFYNVNLD